MSTYSPAPAVETKGLTVTFGYGSRAVEVLHGVDLPIARGASLGLVGGSGSGKSTMAKALVGVVKASAGTIEYGGIDIATLRRGRRRALRRRVQFIPQDPYSSLDPRRTIGQSIAEALDPRRASVQQHRQSIARWLELVHIDGSAVDRYPHEFSGGQRQRVAIARALAVEPEIVIADEITSSLDVSVQAEILALIGDLRATLSITLLFISHSLAVVQQVCDDVAVLSSGRIVERAPTATLFATPQHPYTQQLLAAVPGSPGFTFR